MSDHAEPFRLLFVCTGNTCRSPMAEAIARHRAAERGWGQVEVRSAGIAAFDGSPASGGSLRAAAANGLDLSTHASTLLTLEEVAWADLILTMSPSHLARAVELGAGDRAALLTAFAAGEPEAPGAGAIPDPVGGPDEEYAETYRRLDELVEKVMDRIAAVVAP